MNSWILAIVTLGVFLLAAGGAWLVARRTPRRRQRRTIQWKMWFLVACGVVLGWYAFWADSGLRKTTLHEVILDGAPAGGSVDGEVAHRITFSVEHPDVEHDLMIGPMFRPPTLQRADYEIRLEATVSRENRPPLLYEELTFLPRTQDNNWSPAYLHFTPKKTGPHTLTLLLRTPNIPAIHIRVGDPLKTDGERIAGY